MRTTVYLLAASLLIPAAAAKPQAKRIELIKDESTVTYRITHPLHEIEAVSKEVVYRVEIDPVSKAVKSVTASVDVTTFDSGNSNRDSHAMEVIDALTYPEATFVSTSVTQNNDSAMVAGKLTFHGVTKAITIPVATRWLPNRLEVHGEFQVSLTEFSIERPSLLLIPVSDALKFVIAAAYRWD